MSMVIGTNIASLTAQRHLTNTRLAMETAMERLSSGRQINSSMDDAAGMAISIRMDAQISGFGQAVKNANDGISMLQTAEGGMEQSSNILMRMRELAVQSASGTYSDSDRTNINAEFVALSTELTRISTETKFNEVSVLNSNSTVKLHVGAGSTDLIDLTFTKMGAGHIGGGVTATTATASSAAQSGTSTTNTYTIAATVDGEHLNFQMEGRTYSTPFETDAATTNGNLGAKIVAGEAGVTGSSGAATTMILTFIAGTASGQLTRVTKAGLDNNNVSNAINAAASITSIDTAITEVSTYRGSLGAISNRLEHTVSNLLNRTENTAAAKSRILDTDFAVESSNLSKAQILQQAGTAMLVQANQTGKGVLSLLK